VRKAFGALHEHEEARWLAIPPPEVRRAAYAAWATGACGLAAVRRMAVILSDGALRVCVRRDSTSLYWAVRGSSWIARRPTTTLQKGKKAIKCK